MTDAEREAVADPVAEIAAFVRTALDVDERQARAVFDEQRKFPEDDLPDHKHVTYPFPERVALCVFEGWHSASRTLLAVEAIRGLIDAVLEWEHALLFTGNESNVGPYPCSRDGDVCECGTLDRQMTVLRAVAAEHALHHAGFRPEWMLPAGARSR